MTTLLQCSDGNKSNAKCVYKKEAVRFTLKICGSRTCKIPRMVHSRPGCPSCLLHGAACKHQHNPCLVKPKSSSPLTVSPAIGERLNEQV